MALALQGGTARVGEAGAPWRMRSGVGSAPAAERILYLPLLTAKSYGRQSVPRIEATPDKPVYSKFKQVEPSATKFYGISVDEGWRSFILCAGMYEWAADQLLELLNEAPAHRWNAP